MGIRHRLTDSERDDLTKDVDDLDAVYMEKLRKDGIAEDLLAQFRDLHFLVKYTKKGTLLDSFKSLTIIKLILRST